jgi:hypothetical protein
MRARLVLLALLFVVPLQGLAAATRMLCAPHGAPAAPAVAAHAQGAHDAQRHGHDAVADDAHHAEAASGAHAVAAGAGPAGDPSAAGCAHCAACVVGSALVDASRSLDVRGPAFAPLAHPPARATQRPFDGPERPPRTL